MNNNKPSFRIILLSCLTAFFSAVFLSFGIYNVHAQSSITEGGMLGLVLLLRHWFAISPAVSGFVLDAFCYLLGVKTFGKHFLTVSASATLGFSMGYRFFEQFPPLWPQISANPLAAAILGAAFVGIGTGFCVRAGGAAAADDALAMSLAKILHTDIRWIFLFSDMSVLLLSLSYIPLSKILYSLITVILSGQIIGWMQKLPFPSYTNKSQD